MTMMRLRRGFGLETLADMFDVSETTATNTCLTWINVMSRTLAPLFVRWPSRKRVRKSTKKCKAFKAFPKTHVLIDCTEFYFQKPRRPGAQRATYSHYKSRNTGKLLVGTTPRGTFTFVSKLFTGSISDREITKRSTLMSLLKPGMDVMADRGFTIRDLLAAVGCTLNIPPFCNRKKMAAIATTKTRRIARARITVERAIGGLKRFKILDGTIPLKIKDQMDYIIPLCAALCNVQKILVKAE